MGETELLIFNPKLLFALSSLKQTRSVPPLSHLPPLCWSPNRAGPALASVPRSPFPPARGQLKLSLMLPYCGELPVHQILDSKCVYLCETYSFANISVHQSQQWQCSQLPALAGGAQVGACLG